MKYSFKKNNYYGVALGLSGYTLFVMLDSLIKLDLVNKYAFEYAASQKAPVTGGTTKGLGAVGQVVAQFFHFPFSSFLEMYKSPLP